MVFSNERGSVIDARERLPIYSVTIARMEFWSFTEEGRQALISLAINQASKVKTKFTLERVD